MMVSRARSRTAHCFGVRFRVSSRTMWSWKQRDSKSIRTARGCHGSLAPTCQPIVPSLVFSFQCSKALPRQHVTPPTPPQPQKDPTHPQYLEFGKMAQLLGSSEDQLCALGREGISQKLSTPNSDRKHGAREGRQDEEVEGKCPYCVVSEWRQNNHPFHCVHHHPPELLQYTLQDRLLTHSGEEGEAAGPGNR